MGFGFGELTSIILWDFFFGMTKHITENFPRMPSEAFTMGTKRNMVLYIDKERTNGFYCLMSKCFEEIGFPVAF